MIDSIEPRNIEEENVIVVIFHDKKVLILLIRA